MIKMNGVTPRLQAAIDAACERDAVSDTTHSIARPQNGGTILWVAKLDAEGIPCPRATPLRLSGRVIELGDPAQVVAVAEEGEWAFALGLLDIILEDDLVVVTRHQALVEYLRHQGIVGENCRVLSHVGEDDVRGKHVVGVLPLRLAASAASVTEIPLNLRPDQRGRELSLAEVYSAAGPPVTYVVGARKGPSRMCNCGGGTSQRPHPHDQYCG